MLKWFSEGLNMDIARSTQMTWLLSSKLDSCRWSAPAEQRIETSPVRVSKKVKTSIFVWINLWLSFPKREKPPSSSASIFAYHVYLVGGLEHCLFFHILGIIIPIDFHIFLRGRFQPPTSYVSGEKTSTSSTGYYFLPLFPAAKLGLSAAHWRGLGSFASSRTFRPCHSTWSRQARSKRGDPVVWADHD